MKLNTIIELPDGRRGTIVYHHLDGYGGIWGEHYIDAEMDIENDDIPPPEFMLREKEAQNILGFECVGEEYTIIKE